MMSRTVAAVPAIGRADRAAPREADLTQALYERYATQIFRFCLHRLGSHEEAEDAVQSTFLNAFRGIKRGIVPEQESAWLFKIAENVCLTRRRSTWRRERVESPADFDVVEELTPAPSRLADELLGLQDVLEQLPESQRRAILLREWQGLSYREIAEELELSQSAVETLIFRARRSLAKGLEAPPETARKRQTARGADLGNLLTGLKSLLLGSGAAAAKVAAVVAVVGAGTVVVASPAPTKHHASVPTVPAPTPLATVAPTTPAPAAPVMHAAQPPAAPKPHAAAVPPAPQIVEAPPPTEPAGDQASAAAPAPAAPAQSNDQEPPVPPVAPPSPVPSDDSTSSQAPADSSTSPGNGDESDAGAQTQSQSDGTAEGN